MTDFNTKLDELLAARVKVIGDSEWALLGYPEELKQAIIDLIDKEIIDAPKTYPKTVSAGYKLTGTVQIPYSLDEFIDLQRNILKGDK